MKKQLRALVTLAVVAAMALFLGSPVWAQHGGGHGGGGHGGGGHGGGGGGHGGGGHAGGFSGGHSGGFSGAYHYSSGFRGNGFYGHAYRPYYGANFGFYRPYGYGFYRPYYGAYLPYYDYPYDYGAVGFYSPYYGDLWSYPLAAAYAASSSYIGDGQAQGPAPTDQQPADNAAHLQLTVPENAEVLFDGTRTTQTGSVREFVTGTLTTGARYNYKITVRYADAQGKVVQDVRDIGFQANDWFSIDFTRPPPSRRAPAPAAQPLPKSARDE
jgi:uncharacterized protein (TIGR03000 family)